MEVCRREEQLKCRFVYLSTILHEKIYQRHYFAKVLAGQGDDKTRKSLLMTRAWQREPCGTMQESDIRFRFNGTPVSTKLSVDLLAKEQYILSLLIIKMALLNKYTGLN